MSAVKGSYNNWAYGSSPSGAVVSQWERTPWYLRWLGKWRKFDWHAHGDDMLSWCPKYASDRELARLYLEERYDDARRSAETSL